MYLRWLKMTVRALCCGPHSAPSWRPARVDVQQVVVRLRELHPPGVLTPCARSAAATARCWKRSVAAHPALNREPPLCDTARRSFFTDCTTQIDEALDVEVRSRTRESSGRHDRELRSAITLLAAPSGDDARRGCGLRGAPCARRLPGVGRSRHTTPLLPCSDAHPSRLRP